MTKEVIDYCAADLLNHEMTPVLCTWSYLPGQLIVFFFVFVLEKFLLYHACRINFVFVKCSLNVMVVEDVLKNKDL